MSMGSELFQELLKDIGLGLSYIPPSSWETPGLDLAPPSRPHTPALPGVASRQPHQTGSRHL